MERTKVLYVLLWEIGSVLLSWVSFGLRLDESRFLLWSRGARSRSKPQRLHAACSSESEPVLFSREGLTGAREGVPVHGLFPSSLDPPRVCVNHAQAHSLCLFIYPPVHREGLYPIWCTVYWAPPLRAGSTPSPAVCLSVRGVGGGGA